KATSPPLILAATTDAAPAPEKFSSPLTTPIVIKVPLWMKMTSTLLRPCFANKRASWATHTGRFMMLLVVPYRSRCVSWARTAVTNDIMQQLSTTDRRVNRLIIAIVRRIKLCAPLLLDRRGQTDSHPGHARSASRLRRIDQRRSSSSRHRRAVENGIRPLLHRLENGSRPNGLCLRGCDESLPSCTGNPGPRRRTRSRHPTRD